MDILCNSSIRRVELWTSGTVVLIIWPYGSCIAVLNEFALACIVCCVFEEVTVWRPYLGAGRAPALGLLFLGRWSWR